MFFLDLLFIVLSVLENYFQTLQKGVKKSLFIARLFNEAALFLIYNVFFRRRIDFDVEKFFNYFFRYFAILFMLIRVFNHSSNAN